MATKRKPDLTVVDPGLAELDRAVDRALPRDGKDPDAEDFLAGVDTNYVDDLGVLVGELRPLNMRWAALKMTMARNRSTMASLTKDQRKTYADENAKIAKEQLPKAHETLNSTVRLVAEMMGRDSLDAAVHRQQVTVWLQIPPNLRQPLATYLKKRGYDCADIIAKATATEDEQKRRIAEGESDEEDTP